MNSDIKAKWVAALRSSEYTQGRYALRTANGFCCLGVLCDLHAKETHNGWGALRSRSWHNINMCYPYLEADAALPEEVMVWADLYDWDPRIDTGTGNGELPLSDINDRGTPFSKIAQYIEEQL